jgi:hypothetical protein
MNTPASDNRYKNQRFPAERHCQVNWEAPKKLPWWDLEY